MPNVLACGAEQKNTFCLIKGEDAFVSQHIGDLESLSAYEYYRNSIEHYKHVLDAEPEVIAYDLHPRYISTQYAL
ncbi:carbamoyltransferase HypF, partial [bacterium]|nr:carbamoyltransferase HypF [bacterium]